LCGYLTVNLEVLFQLYGYSHFMVCLFLYIMFMYGTLVLFLESVPHTSQRFGARRPKSLIAKENGAGPRYFHLVLYLGILRPCELKTHIKTKLCALYLQLTLLQLCCDHNSALYHECCEVLRRYLMTVRVPTRMCKWAVVQNFPPCFTTTLLLQHQN
jgi:hypothetical protein